MFVLDFASVRLAVAIHLRAGVELHIEMHFVARVLGFDNEVDRFHGVYLLTLYIIRLS